MAQQLPTSPDKTHREVCDREMSMRLCAAVAFSLPLLAGAPLRAEPYPIAGLTPNQRPAGAPVMRSFEKDRAWLERYHHGIGELVSPSLGAADQQGWYTPFNRPGMLPPYDLRQWHSAQPGGQ